MNSKICLLQMAIILIGLLGRIPPSWSQQQGTRVLKVIKSKELILFRFPSRAKVKVGDELTLQTGGSECEIEVKRTRGNKALASISECPDSARPGQLIWLSKGSAELAAAQKDVKVIYRVYKFNLKYHSLAVKIPRSEKIGVGSEFNVFSNDNQFCKVTILKMRDQVGYGSTKGCKFEFEIRPGLRMELRRGKFWEESTAAKTQKLKKQGRISKVEDYYIMAGVAYPSISYSNALDKENTDGLSSNSAISHLALNIDTGVYVPLDVAPSLLLGGAANITQDKYSGDSFDYTILQISFGPSAYYFFGDRGAGEGIFVRGDIGMAYFTQTEVQSSGTFQNSSQSTPSKIGFGMIGGVGYSYPFWKETRLMAQGTLSMKTMSDSSTTVITVGLGLIF